MLAQRNCKHYNKTYAKPTWEISNCHNICPQRICHRWTHPYLKRLDIDKEKMVVWRNSLPTSQLLMWCCDNLNNVGPFIFLSLWIANLWRFWKEIVGTLPLIVIKVGPPKRFWTLFFTLGVEKKPSLPSNIVLLYESSWCFVGLPKHSELLA